MNTKLYLEQNTEGTALGCPTDRTYVGPGQTVEKAGFVNVGRDL